MLGLSLGFLLRSSLPEAWEGMGRDHCGAPSRTDPARWGFQSYCSRLLTPYADVREPLTQFFFGSAITDIGSGNFRVLWTVSCVGWVSCWSQHVKACFPEVDTDVKG